MAGTLRVRVCGAGVWPSGARKRTVVALALTLLPARELGGVGLSVTIRVTGVERVWLPQVPRRKPLETPAVWVAVGRTVTVTLPVTPGPRMRLAGATSKKAPLVREADGPGGGSDVSHVDAGRGWRIARGDGPGRAGAGEREGGRGDADRHVEGGAVGSDASARADGSYADEEVVDGVLLAGGEDGAGRGGREARFESAEVALPRGFEDVGAAGGEVGGNGPVHQEALASGDRRGRRGEDGGARGGAGACDGDGGGGLRAGAAVAGLGDREGEGAGKACGEGDARGRAGGSDGAAGDRPEVGASRVAGDAGSETRRPFLRGGRRCDDGSRWDRVDRDGGAAAADPRAVGVLDGRDGVGGRRCGADGARQRRGGDP